MTIAVEPHPLDVVVVEPRVLRDYQIEAVAAVESDWAAGHKRVGVSLSTGTGKSTIIGKLASNAYHRGQRVVMLAHRGELIEQMLRDMREVDPGIPECDIGVVRAEEDDHHCPIVGATLQTLASAKRRELLGHRDVILWDEVHHAGATGYHASFTELGGYTGAFMCGLTATMRRADKGKIGLGDVIEKISYERDLAWAVNNGFLVPPVGLTVKINDLNKLNDIRTVAGDFAQNELAGVMEAASSYVVDAVKMHAANRRPIIFAASVEAAHLIGDSLNESGYPAVVITGEQPYTQRGASYDRYRSGEVRAMVTVMVLTEGADFPMCDAAVIARPTRSANLFSQIIGRSLRLFEGKKDALVLDLTGTARYMKLTSLVELLPGADTKVVDENGNEIVEEPEPEPAITSGGPVIPKPRRRGPVELVSVDLLSGNTREAMWLDTVKKIPFVSLIDGWIVFLWPKNGVRQDATQWAVGNINSRTRKGGWMGREERYLPLEDAIDYAEKSIVAAGFEIPRRGASWHASSQAPSDAQINLARMLGIVEYADMTKGRLSDEISIAFASQTLDHAVADTYASPSSTQWVGRYPQRWVG